MIDVSNTPLREAAEKAREKALAFLEQGLFAEAVAAYDSALSSAREVDDDDFVDWIYVCRATAVAECAPANAELLELKQILLRSTDSRTAFRAAYTSSRIYELRRDFKKALFYNRIARQHAEKLADPILAGHSENQYGNLLTADSSFKDASEAYERALDAVRSASDFSEIWHTIWRENLGYCLLALDRVEEGLEIIHAALGFLESRDALSYTVVPLMDLCYGYLKLDRYEEAAKFGELGLERIDLAADPSIEKNLLYLLGETSHLMGDRQAASAYFDQLAAHYPDFRNLRAYLDVFDFRKVINLRA